MWIVLVKKMLTFAMSKNEKMGCKLSENLEKYQHFSIVVICCRMWVLKRQGEKHAFKKY